MGYSEPTDGHQQRRAVEDLSVVEFGVGHVEADVKGVSQREAELCDFVRLEEVFFGDVGDEVRQKRGVVQGTFRLPDSLIAR